MRRPFLKWRDIRAVLLMPAVLISMSVPAFALCLDTAPILAAIQVVDDLLAGGPGGMAGGVLAADIQTAGAGIVAEIGQVDSHQGAEYTKFGDLLVKAMETQAANRTSQINAALAGEEGAKRSVSPTYSPFAAAGSAVAQGEMRLQAAGVTYARDQAARSLGASKTAAASGQAAAAADLANAHLAVLKNPVPLPGYDPPAAVTDLSAASLFADIMVKLPSGAAPKTDSSGTVGELFVDHVFDPRPPPPPRNAKEPPEIQEARNTRAARMDLAMSLPLGLVSQQMPQFEHELRDMLPSVLDMSSVAGTPLSQNELVRYSVEGRYANKEWYDTVQGMNDEQAANEALFMQALKLYLKWQRFQVEQKAGVVLAAALAGRVDAMPGSAAREITPTLAGAAP